MLGDNFKNDNFFSTEILIVNDNSSEKINIDNKNFTNLKNVGVDTLQALLDKNGKILKI